MDLENTVALITGGAQGIGFAAALHMAQRGAKVVIADKSQAQQAAAQLQAQGLDALAIDVDVSKADQVQSMVQQAKDHYGRIDSLINNAGIYASLTPKPFEQLTEQDWHQVLGVNVVGMFLVCQAVLPVFEKSGGGRIVNISSGVAFKGNPWMAHYVASKGAVISFTRALATELGGRNILVNSVAPGFTLSDGVHNNPTLIQGVKEPSLRNRVLARDMLPNDLVGAIAFFASPHSAFITGQTLVVDGGAYFH